MTVALAVALAALLVPAPAPAHAAPAAVSGTYRVAVPEKIITLDPQAAGENYSRQATQLFYESLYEFHYLKRPYVIVPALAEALPKAGRGFRSFTIRLRKKVFFHDDPCFEATGGKGRELTSRDVVTMFERLASAALRSPYYGTFEHLIEGIDEYHAGKAATISGVRVLGPYEVELRLTQPHPRLALDLVDSRTSLVPGECVAKYGDRFAMHPVGTGAFRAGRIEPGSLIEGVRNPAYTRRYPSEGGEARLRADAGAALPLVDKVVLEVIRESQPAWLKFLAGQYEVADVPPDSLPSTLTGGKLATSLAGKGLQLTSELQKRSQVLVFNMKDPVWGATRELRQAFALALDIPQLIQRLFAGEAERLHSLVAPNMYGFDPKFKSRWATRDLARARKLLAQAGYPDGKGLPPIVASVVAEAEKRRLMEFISRQVAEAGITLTPEPVTWPELLSRINRMSFGLVNLGFITESPDADDAVSRATSSYSGVGDNSSGYRNPEIDRLGDELTRLSNGPERLRKIHRFQDILDVDLPYIPLLTRRYYQLAQPWVRNHVYVDQSFLGMFMKYQRVDAR